MNNKTLVERLRSEKKRSICLSGNLENILGVKFPCQGMECDECYARAFNILADAIEREYLPRPRFEDGYPVQFGDTAEVRGDVGSVIEMKYQDNKCVEVGIAFDGGESSSSHCMVYDGERVKRPEPEVLDADGVPIRKGDTVWCIKRVFGDDCECEVVDVQPSIERAIIRRALEGAEAIATPINNLTHKEPDSLERIEEDALMASTDYCDKYGLLDSGCNAEEGDDAVRHCTDCGLTCEKRMINHLLRRQREVLERAR